MTKKEYDLKVKKDFDKILNFIDTTTISDLDEFEIGYQDELADNLFDFLCENGFKEDIDHDEDEDDEDY